jgi:glucokinase
MASTQSVLGLEIGGTKLQATEGMSDGCIVRVLRASVDRERGAQGILEWFGQAVPDLLTIAREEGRDPKAIGVGFGGPVEAATGRVLVSHQIQGWDGVELKGWFEKRYGLPTVVENDANAAGWAEYRKGLGRGTKNFFYMNIGSGIGGALVVDGHLYNGQGRGAGEIGHVWVPDWTAGTPGMSDKLENLCSGWAIERRLRGMESPAAGTHLHSLCGGDSQRLTCAMLAEAARAGDAFALAEVNRVAQTVALAMANLVTLFHPERIALGGGVALMGEVLLRPLHEALDRRVFGPYRGMYLLSGCELEEDVVTTGALLLAGALGG